MRKLSLNPVLASLAEMFKQGRAGAPWTPKPDPHKDLRRRAYLLEGPFMHRGENKPGVSLSKAPLAPRHLRRNKAREDHALGSWRNNSFRAVAARGNHIVAYPLGSVP